MTNTRPCRAKNPATCPHHGNGAALVAVQRRFIMVEARKAYQKAHDLNPSSGETYDAYEKTQEAQISYSATDQGFLDLEKAIIAIDPEQRGFLIDIRSKAQALRYEEEVDNNTSGWEEPRGGVPASLRPFPININPVDENGVKTLSSVRNPDGSTTHYRWTTKNGRIYSETCNAAGEYDMDSIRQIGKATTDDEAYGAAYSWFRKNN